MHPNLPSWMILAESAVRRPPALCDGSQVRAPVFLAIAAGLMLAPSARADGAPPLYDPSRVALVDLALSDAAQAALAAEPEEYVDATFSLTQGDVEYGPETVEVRRRSS